MQTTSLRGDETPHELQLALGERVNALLSATRALSERSAAHFHDQLQPAAFHIARWLYAFGAAKPSAIADAVGMERSSTSTLIGKMRALGLLDSTPDPTDRRSVTVTLSDTGRRRVADTLEARGAELFARTEGWPPADLAALVHLLDRLLDTPA